jgi:predicted PurR-regulated permease PerM
MDTVLHAFLSWQFLFFCLAIGAVVFVVRKLVEYGMDNWWPLKQWKKAHKDAKLWRSLILPILPILLGQAGALFAKAYPYPEGFSSTSGRLVFGLVAGFTSGLIVRLYMSFLSSKVSEYSERLTSVVGRRRTSKTERIERTEITENSDCPPEDPGASVRDTIQKDDQ